MPNGIIKRINNKQIMSNETQIGNCAKRVLTNVFLNTK